MYCEFIHPLNIFFNTIFNGNIVVFVDVKFFNQSVVDGQFDYFKFLLLQKGALNVRQLKRELGTIL